MQWRVECSSVQWDELNILPAEMNRGGFDCRIIIFREIILIHRIPSDGSLVRVLGQNKNGNSTLDCNVYKIKFAVKSLHRNIAIWEPRSQIYLPNSKTI